MITLLLSATLGVTSAAKLGFDASLNNTWRCGVFVSEPGVKFEPPLVKYFVLQNYGLTTCPAKFKDKYKKGTFAKSCTKMGKSWDALWNGDDRKESGEKYGDEVCNILASELEMTEVPNDVFPEGIQFGYYYNYCEEEEWNDTGARSESTVCCQDGQYKSCDEIFAEYGDEDGETEESNGGSGSRGSGASKSGKGGASDQSGSSESGEDAIDNLKAKLERGENLTEDEVTQLREYIDSLRGTAEFLLQTAAELEAKLL